MSGLNGPQTQATGFNFSHSQLDSQPNYSFADFTQDGNAYSDFPEFSGLTQVNRSVLLQGHSDCLSPNAPVHSCRSPDNTVFARTHLSGQRQTSGLAYSVQLLTLLCCRTQPLKLPGMMRYKHLHWYGSKAMSACQSHQFGPGLYQHIVFLLIGNSNFGWDRGCKPTQWHHIRVERGQLHHIRFFPE